MKQKNEGQTLPKRKWGGVLNEFLWVCAGVNRHILLQCPTDWAKYAGQGGLILFTALMAALSGGYAFSTIFDNDTLSIFFGIFWGLLIFNLDRFIVNTMYSDGEYTISKMEILAGLPRLIIAIFLGLVISNPLELRIFEKEINYEISQMKNELASDNKIAELKSELEILKGEKESVENRISNLMSSSAVDYNKSIAEEIKYIDNEIEQIQRNISSYNSQITSNNQRYNRLRSSVESGQEIPSNIQSQLNGISGKIRTLNSNKNSDERRLNDRIEKKRQLRESTMADIQNEIQKANNEKDSKDINISRKEQEIIEYEKQIGDITKNYDGYMARMEAFSTLRNKSTDVNVVAIFITLLFIIIEVSPTLFKMMVASGPYDDMLNAARHKAKVLAQKKISDINDEVNTQILISTEKNKNKLEAEAIANKELLDKIALTQAELLKMAVEEWRIKELEKIKQDPSLYIKSNTLE